MFGGFSQGFRGFSLEDSKRGFRGFRIQLQRIQNVVLEDSGFSFRGFRNFMRIQDSEY